MYSRQDSRRGKTDRRKTEAVQLITRALELLNPVTLSSTLLHVHYEETERKKKTFLEKIHIIRPFSASPGILTQLASE